ncbi:CLUMA_CG014701, isoform A [Clunio marinus]|uniref:CLUMA_CG014701, isoform A n=1 Tax=Clunio marinus TaxID=568069 RepID=A0A1J1IL97_9DIPT|nr:CLUMA_CG014701, isoform A [Clunio marinus]
MVLVLRCLICHKELEYTKLDPSELAIHMKNEHSIIRDSDNLQDNLYMNRSTEKLYESFNKNFRNMNGQTIIHKNIKTENNRKYFRESPENSLEIENQTSKATRESNQNDELKAIKNVDDDKLNLLSHVQSNMKPERKKVTEKPTAKSQYNPISNKKRSKKHSKLYETSVVKWQSFGDEKFHCPRCLSYKRPVVVTDTEKSTQSSFVATLWMTCWPLCLSTSLLQEPMYENLHCSLCNYQFGIYDHKRKIVTSSNRENTKA